MSCCPPAPRLANGSSADSQEYRPHDDEILPTETVECYMKRAENPSGLKDDLTETPVDKIANTSIPITANAGVNVTFTLTPGSQAVTAWQFTGVPSWLTVTGATLSGVAPATEQGKKVEILVEATGASGFIDGRKFVFSPTVATANNSIQFVNPLPKGRVTSVYGPRVHPTRGVRAPHKGIDLSTPGSAVSDVLAAADGEVVFTGFQAGGAGNYLKINHYDGAGKILCQTVYMHLDKFYVTQGTRVAAGQKIGLEGNTGAGTAAHLHFECRLLGKETTWIDPLPLIRGTTQVFEGTKPNNEGGGALASKTSDARLTAADAAVKGGCEEFGPNYGKKPGDPPTPTPTPPTGPTEPANVFDRAWYFTMTYEVGPHWETAPQFSPPDPELAAGFFETPLQRKKVGYKNPPGYPGGETKFGIAQGPNKNTIKVSTIDYAGSKNVGYRNYWKFGSSGPHTLEASQPRTAIMLFDMFYLHGPGNARHIRTQANVAGLSDVASCNALHAAQVNFIERIVAGNASYQNYRNGWLNRSRALLQYALSTPL